MPASGSGSAMWGNQKRPRGGSSGRNSSMIKGYVKGARNVNPFCGVESGCSVGSGLEGERRWYVWLLRVAFLAKRTHQVDSLASKRNPPWPPMLSGKVLKLSHNFPQGRRGGFQVASPVKKPIASEMPRSAPPHTFGAGEEPLGGGGRSLGWRCTHSNSAVPERDDALVGT